MRDEGTRDAGPTAEFVREGDYWAVCFDDRELRIRDSKGMGYLAQLLAHPNDDIGVLALAAEAPAVPPSAADIIEAGPVDDGSALGAPLLDEQARHAYRERLADLRDEIGEAETFHDPERLAQARAEQQAILDELTAATGLHGRDRRAGTPTERARLNVTRAIRGSIARLAEHDRELGEHLTACIHTGRICVYRPRRESSPQWSVQSRPAARPVARRPSMPDAAYAHNGELSIAYQVVGDGPGDAILVNGLAAHLDLWWADPDGAEVLQRLASRSRLMLFDKPGTGISDPVAGAPSLEQRMGDILAVMDAVGSERATLIGYSEGGLASAMFAATYPERTERLVLVNSTARSKPGDDLPAEFDRFWWCLDKLIVERWGQGAFLREMAPSWNTSAVRRRWTGFLERACASPGMVRAMVAALRDYDVRPVLPAISAPTLVLHSSDDPLLGVQFGRELARLIPNARLVEVPSVDHIFFAGSWEPFVSEIEEFLVTEVPQRAAERVLQTVLLVETAQPVGEHAEPVRRQLTRFGGSLAEQAERHILASFDGPSRAVRGARAIIAALRLEGIESRAGVHTGELETTAHGLQGPTLRIAAQIAASAQPFEVLVSRTVCDLVGGSGLQFSDRGLCVLDGAPDAWTLYAAIGDEHADARHVDSVADDVAARTPGPREGMTRGELATLAVAARAPGVVRRTVPRHRRETPAEMPPGDT